MVLTTPTWEGRISTGRASRRHAGFRQPALPSRDTATRAATTKIGRVTRSNGRPEPATGDSDEPPFLSSRLTAGPASPLPAVTSDTGEGATRATDRPAEGASSRPGSIARSGATLQSARLAQPRSPALRTSHFRTTGRNFTTPQPAA